MWKGYKGMTKQITVIYHGGCFDGFGAAWVAKRALHCMPNTDYELLPTVFNEPVKISPDSSEVYVVDFSFPRDVLLEMKKRYPKLVVLDHHKTAKSDLEGLDFCTFDMERSGAMMAWNYWFPNEEPPALIKYVQDRDLWQFKLRDSRQYHAGLSTYPREFPIWDDIVDNEPQSINDIVGIGNLILDYNTRLIDDMLSQVTWRSISGYDVPVVNATVLFPDIGNELCKRFPDAPFSAYYFDRKDGSRHWGLRSIGDFDVSDTARQYGGGGHKNASGFIMTIHQIFPIVKQR